MFASIVVTVAIERPFTDVYEFLAEPLNFSTWAANPGSDMEPLDGGDWLVDLPRGRMVIRFAQRNTFGVLDYQVFPRGAFGGAVTPVRLVANGTGSLLTITWFQREGVTDERFQSDAEWIASDLQRLKTLLEGG